MEFMNFESIVSGKKGGMVRQGMGRMKNISEMEGE
jgi:hypothetical protein